MKKYFSNIRTLAALLMAGTAFAACSSDDNSIEQPANPTAPKTYTLTINASNEASTRALKLEGESEPKSLTAYWENGDELTAYNVTKGEALTGTLTASNASGATATFSGSLTGTIEKDDVLTLSYHQPAGFSAYAAQDGTLASAAERDFATASVTVASVESGEITTTDDADFETQTAVLKLTLTDGTNKLNATQLKLSATMTMGGPMTVDIATFNLSGDPYSTNGDGILYFALPNASLVAEYVAGRSGDASLSSTMAIAALLPSATLTYTATVGSDTYTATKEGYTFAAGKYYAGTLTMEQAYAANQYNEGAWDGTKVIFTKQTAASVTAVADANSNVTWGDGWYTVSGNVTITGNVTLTADTYLILQDGATLTINGQLNCRTNKKNLYIYGQKKGDGKLNVTNNSVAINSNTGYRIDIHGVEVTASSAGGNGLNTGYLAVYGGKLTATSGGGNGINFNNTIDVYDGEVEATSNATSGLNPCYGIRSGGSASQILTVYGGKVTATGNGIEDMDFGDYGSGFGCYVMSGTSGIKFYFSDNGTTWDDGTGYASATSAGRSSSASATQKRYAKAE